MADVEPPVPRTPTGHPSASPRPRWEHRQRFSIRTPSPDPRLRRRSRNHVRLRPASPEVISSLIDSLTAISLPARDHFERLPALGLDGTISQSATPVAFQSGFPDPLLDGVDDEGSFGVTYGHQGGGHENRTMRDFDDAAEPPVIRTAKPPSGLSSLTASKREKESSLRSYLRSVSASGSNRSLSRPSSRDRGGPGSTRAISPENVPSRASNSSLQRWSAESKRSAQGQRSFSLSYMSSRERMRSREGDRRLATVTAAGINARSATPERLLTPELSAKPSLAKKPSLAESPIIEEPVIAGPSKPRTIVTPEDSAKRKGKRPMLNGEAESPVIDSSVVPERGSSLRHAESPTPKTHRRRQSSGRYSLQTSSVVEEDEDDAAPPPIRKHSTLDQDDDATTKRIKELKRQKELRNSSAPILSNFDVVQRPRKLRVAHSSNSVLSRTSSDSSLSDRAPVPAPSNPAAKAHRTLGITPPSPVFSKRQRQVRLDGLNGTHGGNVSRGMDQTRGNAMNFLAELSLEYNDPMQMLGRFHANIRNGVSSEGAPCRKQSISATSISVESRSAAAGEAASASQTGDTSTLAESSRSRLSNDTVSPTLSAPPNSPEAPQKMSTQIPAPAAKLPARANSKKKRWSHPDLPLFAEQRFSKRHSSSDMHAVKALNDSVIEERPSSRDSISEDVESFLQAPRLSQKVQHPQTGRIISFSEVGDPQGFAVFCCVGMGLTRYVMAFYDELAASLKLRLITPDRPGVGESQSDPSGTPLSWPDDVLAICSHLGIEKFSLMAHSAGAIYALATALRMPQHIRGRVHLLAPWIPPSQMSSIGLQPDVPPAAQLPKSQRFLRVLPTSFLKVANSTFMSATSASIAPTNQPAKRRRSSILGGGLFNSPSSSTLGSTRTAQRPPVDPSHRQSMLDMDRTMPTGGSNLNLSSAAGQDPDQQPDNAATATRSRSPERRRAYDARLTLAIWARATAHANPAVDLLVCLERGRPIGFRYVDITRSIIIHHGSRDTRVPLENVRWLGRTMKRCEVRVLEGEGHGLMASAVVMGRVLEEVGREWGEWMEVVEGRGRRGMERERERERE